MKNIKPLLLFICCAFSGGAWPSNTVNDYIHHAQQQAIQQKLEAKREWIALGHYRDHHVNLPASSEADDTLFFLAPNGKADARAELLATIAGFFEPAFLNDHHPQCIFPARFFWIKKELSLDENLLPHPACKEFTKWKNELNASNVVLVFPSAYLNSPSSMFGHTFLRLDSSTNQHQSDLLSYAINYAANMNTNDGEIMFAYKGIFGGYPGTTYVQPYYEKVKEYHDWENRDIWEYTLNFNQDEVDQLVRHAWEIKPVNFDYYFFTENCSYRVLDLIEVAKPSLNIVDRFRYRAIPSDTVRAVVNEQLVRKVNYRPSAATELSFKIKQLSRAEQRLAKDLAEGTIAVDSQQMMDLNAQQKAAVLETAYAYLHYKQLHDKLSRESVADTGLQLLAARSKIENVTPLPLPTTPPVRPDQGHDTKKLSLASGVLDNKTYGDIGFQMAYHGLLDPSPGYQRGAQIEFLSGHARFYEKGNVELEKLKFINITSLSPRNDFFNPLSWNMGVGLRRELVNNNRPLVTYGEGAVGTSYWVDDQLIFLLLHNEIEVDNAFEKDHRLGSGPVAGWQWQYHQLQGLLTYKAVDYWSGDHDIGRQFDYQQTWTLQKNMMLSIDIKRTENHEDTINEVEGGLHVFF